jgi:hypothetical protein
MTYKLMGGDTLNKICRRVKDKRRSKIAVQEIWELGLEGFRIGIWMHETAHGGRKSDEREYK